MSFQYPSNLPFWLPIPGFGLPIPFQSRLETPSDLACGPSNHAFSPSDLAPRVCVPIPHTPDRRERPPLRGGVARLQWVQALNRRCRS